MWRDRVWLVRRPAARSASPALTTTGRYEGITYLSRFGDDLANGALFELPDGHDLIAGAAGAPVSLDDPDLQAAMAHHGLSWFDGTAN